MEQTRFVLIEDDVVYSPTQIRDLLATIEDGNISVGGLTKLLTCWGIIGLIRFTAHHYLSVVTQRSIVALLGGHYIYHIDDTKLLPLTSSGHTARVERHIEEARYLSILQNLEINKTFYYSNTYDITHTLQYNLTMADSMTTNNGFLHEFEEMHAIHVQ